MIGKEKIENRFGFHKASIEGPNATSPKHSHLRLRFIDLATILDEMLPDGRYKDLCFDRLEGASMWAHKAIAEGGELVVDDPKISRALKIMGEDANRLDFNKIAMEYGKDNVASLRRVEDLIQNHSYAHVKPTGEELVELGQQFTDVVEFFSTGKLIKRLDSSKTIRIIDRWHQDAIPCEVKEDVDTNTLIFSHSQSCNGEKCKPTFVDGKLEQ